MFKKKKNKKEAAPKEPREKASALEKFTAFLMVVIILEFGGGGYFLYKNNYLDALKNTSTVYASNGGVNNVSTQPSGTTSGITPVPDYTYDVGTITTNIADDHYIKITLGLGYDNKKLGEELKAKSAVVRDVIIEKLRNSSQEDLEGNGFSKFKQDVLADINKGLDKGPVTGVYISDVIFQ